MYLQECLNTSKIRVELHQKVGIAILFCFTAGRSINYRKPQHLVMSFSYLSMDITKIDNALVIIESLVRVIKP